MPELERWSLSFRRALINFGSVLLALSPVGGRLAFIARDDKGVCEPRVVAAF